MRGVLGFGGIWAGRIWVELSWERAGKRWTDGRTGVMIH
jgi:hypothetical protein